MRKAMSEIPAAREAGRAEREEKGEPAPGRAVDPPRSPAARASCTDEEWVTLVPLADRQLRLALLPWVE